MGADIELVRQGIGSDPRIGYHFLYAGCGYGGSCFPKDVKALIRTASEQAARDLKVLQAVEDANDAQKQVLVAEDRQALRRRPEPASRFADLGPGVQAQHGRHARGQQPAC